MINRRGNKEGALYQRCDHPSCPPAAADGTRPEHRCRGRWVGAISLRPVGAKARRKVVYGRTQKEAAEKLAKMQQRYASGILSPDSWSVAEWVEHWMEYVAPDRGIRDSTLYGYRSKLDKHILPHLGALRLDRLEPDHVRVMYRDMRKRGLADSTLVQTRAILRVILGTAMDEGKVVRNAAELARLPRRKHVKPKALTADQARRVLAAAAEQGDPSRWYIALWLGLRQGEALGLRWRDVDLETGLLTVENAVRRKTGAGMVDTDVKSDASHRIVPLPMVVRSHLMVAWAAHLADLQAGKDRGDPLDWYVWHRDDGRPRDPRTDWQQWTNLLKAAGVPHVRLHSARATAASLLNDAGVDVRTVASIIGHSQVQMTADVYQRTELATAQRAMVALERYAGSGD